jgi:alpha-tubulin suppressor-like RCC1 family protein
MVTTDGRELRPSKNQIDTVHVISSSTVFPSDKPSLLAVQRVESEKGVFKKRLVDVSKVNDNLGIPWFDETELFLGKDGEIYAVGRENHPEAGRATEIIYDPKVGILNTLAHFHM